ncbi:MAG: glutamine synthetase III [Chitinophagales bacterium]|nr:glutamine synthetase III [Chitinophagales bacterium]MDW8273185.1 glutamine synthetase III [Chitinophagales bacterium]
MLTQRKKAIETVVNREPVSPRLEGTKVSDYYGINVFNDKAMREYLSDEAYKAVKEAMRTGTKISRDVADAVAAGMKTWAIKKGANSYTHWFQPLTGLTAEKHDMFFTPKGDGAIEVFSGDALVQQEPDASSFPSGGIRATFEARGYTAWDPSSPAFIMEIGDGKTLCIPTIFISYTGETLDYKAPLLKSCAFLERAALPVVHMFDKDATKVTATLGWEQEYFLIDEALYYARPDLMACGRTLFGASSSKGQQLEDHYFGSIPERVYAFMLDLEAECHKLGIPIRTRHNEVAPSQFECAPMFEEVSVAVDHNQLLMDLMERVARRHKLRVLLHEKPFAGINGSGKHNNWSLGTDTGKNLLSPGKTPKNNLLFLTFFVNVLKAVSEYGDLIRASIASAGNDHRLGANEAPPAIISAFIGSYMTNVLDEIEKRVAKGKYDELANATLKLDIHNKIPDVLLDNTDRNRTSPFAFTGNKFEVRAVGSSANCASTMTVMNTIMGQQLLDFKAEVDKLIKEGESKEGAIMRVIRQYISDSRKICFEGDGYSEAWQKEAKKRGLNNVKTTPYALDFLKQKKYKDVFVKNGIFTEREIDARYEVENHKYILKINIEAKTMIDLVTNQIIPAAVEYSNKLVDNIQGLKSVGIPASAYKAQKELLEEISEKINTAKATLDKLNKALEGAHNSKSTGDEAKYYCDKVKPVMDELRQTVDAMEGIVDDALWPLPKYREMLFIR